jgi:hypothetical protein
MEGGTGHRDQCEGDHAGHQEDEHRRQLEEAGENRTAPRLRLVAAGKNALDDVLVGTPVPETDDRRAGQHRHPRPFGIVIGSDEVDVGARRRDHGVPAGEQIAVAKGLQADEENGHRPEDQHRGLQNGGVHDHAQAAEHGVKAGGEGKAQRDGPEHVHLEAEERDRLDTKKRAHHDVAGVDGGGDLGQHQRGHRQKAEEIARAAAEAQFEELRHGEDLHAVVKRHEHPAQDQDKPALHFPMRHRHAGGKTGAGQADQVLRTDIRREDVGTDLKPVTVAPRQEVILAGLGRRPHRHKANDYHGTHERRRRSTNPVR